MSFVERAKALEQAARIGVWTAKMSAVAYDVHAGSTSIGMFVYPEDGDLAVFVRNCLPELIAVLEAARESMGYCECQNGPCDFCKPTKEALSKLDQKADSGREG